MATSKDVDKERQKQWLEENQAAFAQYNQRIAKHGTFAEKANAVCLNKVLSWDDFFAQKSAFGDDFIKEHDNDIQS